MTDEQFAVLAKMLVARIRSLSPEHRSRLLKELRAVDKALREMVKDSPDESL